jgi:hypothetical protein
MIPKLLSAAQKPQCRGRILIHVAGIKQLIDLTQRGRKPCEHARKAISQHLAEVESQIRELEALRKELRLALRPAESIVARSYSSRTHGTVTASCFRMALSLDETDDTSAVCTSSLNARLIR